MRYIPRFRRRLEQEQQVTVDDVVTLVIAAHNAGFNARPLRLSKNESLRRTLRELSNSLK